MNNFEILNLLESRYGKIPTIARTQLLDIFDLYNLDLNKIEFSLKPIRELNSFFKQLHLNGVRNDDHSILENTLTNGSLFEHEINEYLFENEEESPFSPIKWGFENYPEPEKEDDSKIVIEINDQGKGKGKGKAKAKISLKPKQ